MLKALECRTAHLQQALGYEGHVIMAFDVALGLWLLNAAMRYETCDAAMADLPAVVKRDWFRADRPITVFVFDLRTGLVQSVDRHACAG